MVVPGSGLIVRAAVDAGADALIVLNAGVYRSLGTGSLAAFLPYGNANDQTEALLREHVLPRSAGLPIVAGVFAADPTLPLDDRLSRLKDLGVEGITNWPAMGFLDGATGAQLEADGLGSTLEAEMLARARELGFVTFGFALNVRDVERFLDVGVEGIILDVGLTHVSGDIRTKRDDLQQAISGLNQLSKAVERRPECVKIAFGGPITTSEDLAEVFRHSSIHGFAGGSVFERLPVSEIVGATLRRFKSVAVSERGNSTSALQGVIGRTPVMQRIFELIRRVAPQDITVCIEGESGTGKELVAAQLHRLSPRANHPFITLNCGAIPESLMESELFGHERGAFTGAERRRPGKFELANRGTLFLDEIADLSPRGQVALLRVLQEREVSRVGGDETIPVDVRILAASNRPLAGLVAAGAFRADLFYRLSTISIQLPPLRDRLDDIPLLIEAFLTDLRIRLNRDVLGVSPLFLDKLMYHDWPGNVRELGQVIHRCAILEDGAILEGGAFELCTDFSSPESSAAPSPPSNHVLALHALRQANGNKSKAAAALNVTRKTFYRWLRGETGKSTQANG
ncbi:MAG: sigma 54-interacting transcriptional regulator [Planctomycetaceae bacterium]|nr:sigma 54-interacting transcriptional regulator [Planctomycetaceae bacterium]